MGLTLVWKGRAVLTVGGLVLYVCCSPSSEFIVGPDWRGKQVGGMRDLMQTMHRLGAQPLSYALLPYKT